MWKILIFALVGNNMRNTEYVNGIRTLDRLRKDTFKIEIWLKVGLGSYSKDSEEYKKNSLIKEDVTNELVEMLKPVRSVSALDIYFQDHHKTNNTWFN